MHYWECMDAYTDEKEFALQQEDLASSIVYGLIALAENSIPVIIFFIFRQPTVDPLAWRNEWYKVAWYSMWIGHISVFSLLVIFWPFTYFFDKGFNDAYKVFWEVFGFILGPILHVWVVISYCFALINYRTMTTPSYFTIQLELLVYTLSVATVTWMPLL